MPEEALHTTLFSPFWSDGCYTVRKLEKRILGLEPLKVASNMGDKPTREASSSLKQNAV
jgi:hypothetical protein